MSSTRLIEELRAVANGAPAGGKITVLNLFGIQYAAELKAENLGDLAEQAGVGRSFSAELRRGIRLAEYVQLKV